MKLKFWLFKRDDEIKNKLIDFVEISRTYFYQILKSRVKPSLKIARRIERFTEGDVTIDEVINPEKYPDPY